MTKESLIASPIKHRNHREDWINLVRDVLEKEYFGDWNRQTATQLAENVIAAMEAASV